MVKSDTQQTFNQSMISMIVLVYILLDISWLVYRISGEPWRYFQGQSSWNLHRNKQQLFLTNFAV